jgi:type 1 fimbria pilin
MKHQGRFQDTPDHWIVVNMKTVTFAVFRRRSAETLAGKSFDGELKQCEPGKTGF